MRRSVDGDFIHANVDIDLIISEEPDPDSGLDPRTKPEEIFLVAEHFCLGRRRLHLFGALVQSQISIFNFNFQFSTSIFNFKLHFLNFKFQYFQVATTRSVLDGSPSVRK